jgi:hypothetical protein
MEKEYELEAEVSTNRGFDIGREDIKLKRNAQWLLRGGWQRD